MKTKLLSVLAVLLIAFSSAQSKIDSDRKNLTFYLPLETYHNETAFAKSVENLALQLSPYEIDEKNYTNNGGMIYFLTKNYDGFLKLSGKKDFDKSMLPFKSYAIAAKADPKLGNKFHSEFVKVFTKEFASQEEGMKNRISGYYYDERMNGELEIQRSELLENLAKKKSDSISYDDAITLLWYEGGRNLIKNTMNDVRNLVSGYVAVYLEPMITGNIWLAVTQPKEINHFPDLSKDYRLLFELIDFSEKDAGENAAKKQNPYLVEAARILNLHAGAGIPVERIKAAFVLHGPAMNILMTNEHYNKRYHTDNPNLTIIKQLQDRGFKFVVCGQSMTWAGRRLKEFTENVEEAFSAKTAITSYQNNGYLLQNVKREN